MSFAISDKEPFAFNKGLANKNMVDLDLDSIGDEYYENLKQIDKEKWFYTNKKIDYIHNEYGYRSDLISEIATGDEYILTFGCSYSYGYGLDYEDTYSYKVAKHYNCKNINLSVCGSGIGFHVMNSTLFFHFLATKPYKFPKLVIYQYPSWTRMRKSTLEKTDDGIQLAQHTHNWDTFDKDVTPYYKKYWIMDETEPFTESLVAPIYLNNLWSSQDVPVFHMDWGDFNQKYKSDYQNFNINNYSNFSNEAGSREDYLYELARDLSHNGRNFNDRVAKEIIEETKWLE